MKEVKTVRDSRESARYEEKERERKRKWMKTGSCAIQEEEEEGYQAGWR